MLCKEKWENLLEKKNLEGEKALAAVQKKGDALRYVKDPTEAICLAAVQQSDDALRYVEERFLS